MKLEDLILDFSADTTRLNSAIDQAVQKARSAANQIDSYFNKPYGKDIKVGFTPTINASGLKQLDTLINGTKRSLDQTQQYFNSHPLKIKVNTSELEDVKNDLTSVKRDFDTLDRQLRSHPVHISVDTRDVDHAVTQTRRLGTELAKTRSGKVNVNIDFKSNIGDTIRSQLRTVSISLTPKVNDKNLTTLNEHLARKKAHAQEIQSYFDSNPLTPKSDISELDKINDKLSELSGLDTRAIGVNIGSGVTAGLKASLSGVAAASGQMAETVMDTTEAKLEIKSPSRWGYRVGVNIAQGIENGIKTLDVDGAINLKMGRGRGFDFDVHLYHEVNTANLDSSLQNATDRFKSAGDEVGEKIARRVEKVHVHVAGQGLLGAVGKGIWNLVTSPVRTVASIATAVGRGYLEETGAAFARGSVSQPIERAGQATGTYLKEKVPVVADDALKNLLNFPEGLKTLDNLVKKHFEVLNNTLFNPRFFRDVEDYIVQLGRTKQHPGNEKFAQMLKASREKLESYYLDVLQEDIARITGAAIRLGAQPVRINKRIKLGESAELAMQQSELHSQEMTESEIAQGRAAKGITFVVGGVQPAESEPGKPKLDSTYHMTSAIKEIFPESFVQPVTAYASNAVESYKDAPLNVLRQWVLKNQAQAKQFMSLFASEEEVDKALKEMNRLHPADRISKVNTQGFDEDALKLAAKILAALSSFPGQEIRAFGGSGGGFIVEEAIAILNEVAKQYPELKEAISRVKGVGVGTPLTGLTQTHDVNEDIGEAPAQYRAYLGDRDFVGVPFYGGKTQEARLNSPDPSVKEEAQGIIESQPVRLPPNVLTPAKDQEIISDWGFEHKVGRMIKDLGSGGDRPFYQKLREFFGDKEKEAHDQFQIELENYNKYLKSLAKQIQKAHTGRKKSSLQQEYNRARIERANLIVPFLPELAQSRYEKLHEDLTEAQTEVQTLSKPFTQARSQVESLSKAHDEALAAAQDLLKKHRENPGIESIQALAKNSELRSEISPKLKQARIKFSELETELNKVLPEPIARSESSLNKLLTYVESNLERALKNIKNVDIQGLGSNKKTTGASTAAVESTLRTMLSSIREMLGYKSENFSYLDPKIENDELERILKADYKDISLPEGNSGSLLRMWRGTPENMIRTGHLHEFEDLFHEWSRKADVLTGAGYEKKYKVAPYQVIPKEPYEGDYKGVTFTSMPDHSNPKIHPRYSDILYKTAGVYKEMSFEKLQEAFEAMPVGTELEKAAKDFVKVYVDMRKRDIDLYKRWYVQPLLELRQRIAAGEPEAKEYLENFLKISTFSKYRELEASVNDLVEPGKEMPRFNRKGRQGLSELTDSPDDILQFMLRFKNVFLQFESSLRQANEPTLRELLKLVEELAVYQEELAGVVTEQGRLNETMAAYPFALKAIGSINQQIEGNPAVKPINPFSARVVGGGDTGDVLIDESQGLVVKTLHTTYAQGKLGSPNELAAHEALSQRNLAPAVLAAKPGEFMVMQAVAGKTLESGGGLTEELVQRMGQLLRGIHEAGFTHNDLSTANVMLDHNKNLVAINLANAQRLSEDAIQRNRQIQEDLGTSIERSTQGASSEHRQWFGEQLRRGYASDPLQQGAIVIQQQGEYVPPAPQHAISEIAETIRSANESLQTPAPVITPVPEITSPSYKPQRVVEQPTSPVLKTPVKPLAPRTDPTLPEILEQNHVLLEEINTILKQVEVLPESAHAKSELQQLLTSSLSLITNPLVSGESLTQTKAVLISPGSPSETQLPEMKIGTFSSEIQIFEQQVKEFLTNFTEAIREAEKLLHGYSFINKSGEKVDIEANPRGAAVTARTFIEGAVNLNKEINEQYSQVPSGQRMQSTLGGDQGRLKRQTDKAAEIIAQAGEEVPEYNLEKLKDYEKRMKQSGQAIGEGLPLGMQQAMPKVEIVSEELGETPREIVREINQIESPSRVFIGIGNNIAEGLASGIGAGTETATDAGASMANAVKAEVQTIFEVHSKSRWTDRVGKWIIEGLQAGLESTSINLDFLNKFKDEFQSKSEEAVRVPVEVLPPIEDYSIQRFNRLIRAAREQTDPWLQPFEMPQAKPVISEIPKPLPVLPKGVAPTLPEFSANVWEQPLPISALPDPAKILQKMLQQRAQQTEEVQRQNRPIAFLPPVDESKWTIPDPWKMSKEVPVESKKVALSTASMNVLPAITDTSLNKLVEEFMKKAGAAIEEAQDLASQVINQGLANTSQIKAQGESVINVLRLEGFSDEAKNLALEVKQAIEAKINKAHVVANQIIRDQITQINKQEQELIEILESLAVQVGPVQIPELNRLQKTAQQFVQAIRETARQEARPLASVSSNMESAASKKTPQYEKAPPISEEWLSEEPIYPHSIWIKPGRKPTYEEMESDPWRDQVEPLHVSGTRYGQAAKAAEEELGKYVNVVKNTSNSTQNLEKAMKEATKTTDTLAERHYKYGESVGQGAGYAAAGVANMGMQTAETVARTAIDVVLPTASGGAIGFIEGFKKNFEGLTEQMPVLKGFAGLLTEIGQAALFMFGAFSAGQLILQFGQDVAKTAVELERLKVALDFTTEGHGAETIERIRNQTDKLGLSFDEASKGYVNMRASTVGTPLEGQTDTLFKQLNKGIAARALPPDQAQSAYLAITETIGRGRVQNDVLIRQLGEALPGALQTAARAMGVTQTELIKMADRGNLLAEDLIPRFLDQLSSESVSGIAGASKTAQAGLNRLNNEIEHFKENVGGSSLGAQKFGINLAASSLELANQHPQTAGSVVGGLALASTIQLGITLVSIANRLGLAKLAMTAFGVEAITARVIVQGIAMTLAKGFVLSIVTAGAIAVLEQVWTEVDRLSPKIKDANASLETSIRSLEEAYGRAGKAADDFHERANQGKGSPGQPDSEPKAEGYLGQATDWLIGQMNHSNSPVTTNPLLSGTNWLLEQMHVPARVPTGAIEAVNDARYMWAKATGGVPQGQTQEQWMGKNAWGLRTSAQSAQEENVVSMTDHLGALEKSLKDSGSFLSNPKAIDEALGKVKDLDGQIEKLRAKQIILKLSGSTKEIQEVQAKLADLEKQRANAGINLFGKEGDLQNAKKAIEDYADEINRKVSAGSMQASVANPLLERIKQDLGIINDQLKAIANARAEFPDIGRIVDVARVGYENETEENKRLTNRQQRYFLNQQINKSLSPDLFGIQKARIDYYQAGNATVALDHYINDLNKKLLGVDPNIRGAAEELLGKPAEKATTADIDEAIKIASTDSTKQSTVDFLNGLKNLKQAVENLDDSRNKEKETLLALKQANDDYIRKLHEVSDVLAQLDARQTAQLTGNDIDKAQGSIGLLQQELASNKPSAAFDQQRNQMEISISEQRLQILRNFQQLEESLVNKLNTAEKKQLTGLLGAAPENASLEQVRQAQVVAQQYTQQGGVVSGNVTAALDALGKSKEADLTIAQTQEQELQTQINNRVQIDTEAIQEAIQAHVEALQNLNERYQDFLTELTDNINQLKNDIEKLQNKIGITSAENSIKAALIGHGESIMGKFALIVLEAVKSIADTADQTDDEFAVQKEVTQLQRRVRDFARESYKEDTSFAKTLRHFAQDGSENIISVDRQEKQSTVQGLVQQYTQQIGNNPFPWETSQNGVTGQQANPLTTQRTGEIINQLPDRRDGDQSSAILPQSQSASSNNLSPGTKIQAYIDPASIQTLTTPITSHGYTPEMQQGIERIWAVYDKYNEWLGDFNQHLSDYKAKPETQNMQDWSGLKSDQGNLWSLYHEVITMMGDYQRIYHKPVPAEPDKGRSPIQDVQGRDIPWQPFGLTPANLLPSEITKPSLDTTQASNLVNQQSGLMTQRLGLTRTLRQDEAEGKIIDAENEVANLTTTLTRQLQKMTEKINRFPDELAVLTSDYTAQTPQIRLDKALSEVKNKFQSKIDELDDNIQQYSDLIADIGQGFGSVQQLIDRVPDNLKPIVKKLVEDAQRSGTSLTDQAQIAWAALTDQRNQVQNARSNALAYETPKEQLKIRDDDASKLMENRVAPIEALASNQSLDQFQQARLTGQASLMKENQRYQVEIDNLPETLRDLNLSGDAAQRFVDNLQKTHQINLRNIADQADKINETIRSGVGQSFDTLFDDLINKSTEAGVSFQNFGRVAALAFSDFGRSIILTIANIFKEMASKQISNFFGNLLKGVTGVGKAVEGDKKDGSAESSDKTENTDSTQAPLSPNTFGELIKKGSFDKKDKLFAFSPNDKSSSTPSSDTPNRATDNFSDNTSNSLGDLLNPQGSDATNTALNSSVSNALFTIDTAVLNVSNMAGAGIGSNSTGSSLFGNSNLNYGIDTADSGMFSDAASSLSQAFGPDVVNSATDNFDGGVSNDLGSLFGGDSNSSDGGTSSSSGGVLGSLSGLFSGNGDAGSFFSSLFGIGGGGGGAASAFTSDADLLAFKYGGTVPVIYNYASGGTAAAALGQSIMDAMKREGPNAVPIVASSGEEILSTTNNDAQFYRALKASNNWEPLKRVQNFDVGGTVGGGSVAPAYRPGQRVSSGGTNVTVIQNISTPDANSFRKSQSQLHSDSAYQARRAYERNH